VRARASIDAATVTPTPQPTDVRTVTPTPAATDVRTLTPTPTGGSTGGPHTATRTATPTSVAATSTSTPLPTTTATAQNPTPSATVAVPTASPSPRQLLVGAATRSLNPNIAVAPPDGQVFLGGFGLGAVRRSTGILDIGAQTRALVIDNGDSAIALVESDNQGAFVAYELGRAAAGSQDIELAVQTLRPALHADHIVIAADHSHAGQDLIGVWGGVPNEYLEFVKAQITAAIVEAYDTREVANVAVGSVGGIISATPATS